uniref:Zf-RVT domain-containing protein n=1 Tax=Haemonchus contortus TaxID=6289 RepID=A0A7I4XSK2_HAECO|nr:unnamed protein product [Haemonchus contortus]
MMHKNKTTMEKTLSKSSYLVKLRGILYEPRCGEPNCFHEWFQNCDHNSNPVKQHIELYDIVYPAVRNTIGVNMAGAADRRILQRAYRVFCHLILAKIAMGNQDTEVELSTLKWWMKSATALVETQFPNVESAFIFCSSAKCDDDGFIFTTNFKGASAIAKFTFYEGMNHDEKWHVSVTACGVVMGDKPIRKLVEAAIYRRMSLCEFIETLLWPFMDRLSMTMNEE